MLWKLPPRIKVLEALGSIADHRVELAGDTAKVVSSRGDRTYTVRYAPERNEIDSDDNGSVYRGYLGYPSIALLMLKAKLPFEERYAEALKKIPWKILNETYKSYAVVEKKVKEIASRKGVRAEELDAFIEKVLGEIQALGLSKPL
jgi:hypothetical protein